MDDPTPRGHQVDRAGLDHCVAADAVAVLDRAVEQISDGGEIDVRMGADVHALAGREPRRAELIDEDERPDHRPLARRKGAIDLEISKVVGDGRYGLKNPIFDRGHQSSPGAVARIDKAWTCASIRDPSAA